MRLRRDLPVVALLAGAAAAYGSPVSGDVPDAFPFRVPAAERERHRALVPPAVPGVPVLALLEGGSPPSGTVVHLLAEEARGEGWRWLDGRQAAGSATVRLEATRADPDGFCLLLATSEGSRGYRLSEPFRCPATSSRRSVPAHLRISVRGQLPAAPGNRSSAGPAVGSTFRRLPPTWLGERPAASSWPRCAEVSESGWLCRGIPRGAPGLVVLGIDPVAFVPVGPDGETGPPGVAGWARLACLDGDPPDAWLTAEVEVLRPTGDRVLFLDPDPTAFVRPLGAGCFWLGGAGEAPLDDGLLRLRGEKIATGLRPLRELLATPVTEVALLPVTSPAALAGRLAVPEGFEASWDDALVQLFTLGPADDERRPVAGFFLEEVRVARDGTFTVEGVEAGRYLVQACHPAAGCRRRVMVAGAGRRTLSLAPERVVRGQATYAGLPQEGVAVRATATVETYLAARDPARYLTLAGTTDEDGRFILGLPGAGQFRLELSSAEHGSAFRRLGPMEDLPPETDLGEIRLPGPVLFRALFPACPWGRLQLVGPLGGEAAVPAVATVELDAAGEGTTALGAAGAYGIAAECGGPGRVETEPGRVEIPPGLPEIGLFFRRANG